MVLAAVANDGQALQFASEDLRADREVVTTAINEDGWALEHAAEEFRPKLRRTQSSTGFGSKHHLTI